MSLTEGTYRLTCDVTNPKPDRRANQHHARSWRSHVTWKQGMVFIVTPSPNSPSLLRIYLRDGFEMDAVMDRIDQEAFTVLAGALERIEEEPSDLLVRLEHSLAGQYALRMLDKIGLSEKKIRALIEEIENEWQAEEENP